MSAGETAQQRLSRLARRRRIELGLSVRAAAKLAGIDRNTWASLEEGTRATRDRLYSKIERALQWPDGEVDRILNGDDDATDGPTDEQIIAMTLREVATFAVRLGRGPGGAEARGVWLRHAMAVRDAALRALVTEVN